MDIINFDAQGNPTAHGNVAGRLLASNLNVQSLRSCDVLRKDEWKQFDERLIQIARSRLIGVGDLISAGLTKTLNNALGTTVLEWEDVSDMEPAELSMSGVTEGQNDRVVYNLKQLPVPIGHKDFNLNIRALASSRNRGESLDTTQMEVSGRKVAELNESTLFNGATLVSGGASITGYTTAANRNTGSLTADWALVGTTGINIVDDVIAMIAALTADNMFGPYWLYVPIDYKNKLANDYKTNSDKTIMTRLMEIDDLVLIKGSSNLTGAGSGEVILVQPTLDVVDMVVGMEPTTVMWEGQGGMITYFKVMSIMVPRMKSDQINQSGIAHFSV